MLYTERLSATERRALEDLNRSFIVRVDALRLEFQQAAQAAGLGDDVAAELVGYLSAAADDARRLQYQLRRQQQREFAYAHEQRQQALQQVLRLRDAAEIFWRPGDGQVTIGRPDRNRPDKTYDPTPTSERRVRQLMDERSWPTRTHTVRGWEAVTTEYWPK